MFFDDNSAIFLLDEDSRARRTPTGGSLTRASRASPKDSTRMNDYDMSLLLDASASTLDTQSRPTRTTWRETVTNTRDSLDDASTSLGFDSYIRAIAKPQQQPPAMPAPPDSILKRDGRPLRSENFAFGLQSFLRTVERDAPGVTTVPHSSSSSAAGQNGTTSNGVRNKARSDPTPLASSGDTVSVSLNSSSLNRRHKMSNGTSANSTTPASPVEDSYLLDRFLTSTRTRTKPNVVTPPTAERGKRPVSPLSPAYPRTTRAEPLVMGNDYLSGFLENTMDSSNSNSGRRSTHPTTRPRRTSASNQHGMKSSSTDTETEPFTPFLDAAAAADRALKSGKFDPEPQSSQTRRTSLRPTDKKATPTSAAAMDSAPSSSTSRRSSRRPSIVTDGLVEASNGASHLVHSSGEMQPLTPPAISMSTPNRAKRASFTLKSGSTISTRAGDHPSSDPPLNPDTVLSMMAEHPVAAATRNGSPGTVTLLPPLSPGSTSLSSTRRRLSDTNASTPASDHVASRSHDEPSSRGGSLPALTPRTSSGAWSGGSASLNSDSTDGLVVSVGRRRMSRPRPTSSSKDQQALTGVVVPTVAATTLSASSTGMTASDLSALATASERRSSARQNEPEQELLQHDKPAPPHHRPLYRTEPTPPSQPARPVALTPPATRTTTNNDSLLNTPTKRAARAASFTAPSTSSLSSRQSSNGNGKSTPTRPTRASTLNTGGEAGRIGARSRPVSAGGRSSAASTRSTPRSPRQKLALRMRPLPLQQPNGSILIRQRLFDPKAKPSRTRRAPPRRSLPDGKRRANWIPPPTNYTATLHEWCGESDEEDEEDDGVDVAIDAPSSPHSAALRLSQPSAIMVDEVDKKRFIASEEGALLSPKFGATSALSHGGGGRMPSSDDVVRVSRSFDLNGTPLNPSFCKVSGSMGSDGSPPPSRGSRQHPTPLLGPGMTLLDSNGQSMLWHSNSGRRSDSPPPQVSFAPGVEDIPF